MKNLIIIVLTLFFISCEKDNFDIENPDVDKFVHQIKTGTYSQYEKGENGQNLWLLLPNFTEKHLPSLIGHSKDTTHIKAYPFNPFSSPTPFPNGRNYCILGECLLWTVEGIRNGFGYGSLDHYLVDTSLIESIRYNGLKGTEILVVRDLYNDWRINFGDKDWKTKNPLENTSYRWF